jgi:hypothetical protein
VNKPVKPVSAREYLKLREVDYINRPVEARLVPSPGLALASLTTTTCWRKDSSNFILRAVSMHHTRRAVRKLIPVFSHSKGLSYRCVLLSFCLAYRLPTATLYHNATRSGASMKTSSRLFPSHSLASKSHIASACHYSSQAQSADSPSPDKYAPRNII